jgi:hypothetical protein
VRRNQVGLKLGTMLPGSTDNGEPGVPVTGEALSMQEAIDDLDLRLAVLSTRLDLLSATIAVLTGNAKATRDADADTPHRPD